MARQDQRQDQEQKRPTAKEIADFYKFGPRGDYTHGHPGLPPKNYKQPEEKKGFFR